MSVEIVHQRNCLACKPMRCENGMGDVQKCNQVPVGQWRKVIVSS
jgi:hypothetical protein